MTSSEIRQAFMDFFRSKGHEIVPSAPIVVKNDPTLMFTNAGMNQFKDYFLGNKLPPYGRMADTQKCLRVSGKHNDLEEVGVDTYHHTMFEMLGNWSFGDYFKNEAIEWSWELLTEVYKIPKDRLYATVFEGDAKEGLPASTIALKKWKEVLPENHIVYGNKKDNFWEMGDTGPCGPCSEIFYDHGAHIPGGPPGSPNEDGDRYVEIWNLVFMQYERSADGKLTPLPKPSVDTGAGLERLSAVMQGVPNNYDIDLFRKLMQAAASLAKLRDLTNPSLRVIADHIRACTFLIVDGVTPSNEGRGYVLRRIIRRAIRHGYKLGLNEPFFYTLVATLEAEMGEAYPELRSSRALAERVLRQEEERFAETLSTGISLLDSAIARLGTNKQIDGDTVFKLYDTYGFPVDLTADIARERALSIDQAGFEAAMEAQRERARAASRFSVDLRGGATLAARSEFSGYEQVSGVGRVVALIRDGIEVKQLTAGESGEIVLDHTPFYAESGGQVGDAGELRSVVTTKTSSEGLRFSVSDTQKRSAAIAHLGRVESGAVAVGDQLSADVDVPRRDATRRHHTATHLLHAALRSVLGSHVQQKGSLVAPERLRFDFAHFSPLTEDEQQRIEQLVNEQIRANAVAETTVRSYDDAVAAGAMALFGEKYESNVRVLKLGEFSMELCGGTHVARAGDIGLFKIVSEGGVAAGVRRIEALAGAAANAYVDQHERELRAAAGLLRGRPDELVSKVGDALERIKQLERENRQLRDKLASGAGTDVAAGAVDVGGIKVVAAQIDGADAGALRNAVDQLKTRLQKAVIVLASSDATGKVTLVAGVTAGETAKLKAGEIVANIAQQLGGKGGGRPDFAQGGGSDAGKLPQALADVPDWVRRKIG
jgi:alanyl-tRNA synthetase